MAVVRRTLALMKTLVLLLSLAWCAWGVTCNVTDYGLPAGAGQLATKAIQAAIDDCSSKGGGTVNVPSGEFTAAGIKLKDNVNLHLEAGTVLVPSQARADYGGGVLALITSEGAKNIALTGRGTLDGRARYKFGGIVTSSPMIPNEIAIAKAAGVDMRIYNHDGAQVNLIHLRNSSDILIEGIKAINSQFWTCHIQGCDRVRVRGVYLYSDLDKALNADGIDLVSSRNVTISDSVIVTADDSICLKADPGGPVENIAVTNCVLTSSSCAFKIGSRTRADVRHVVFSNSVIRDSNRGFGIQDPIDGVVSDILVSNITMDMRRRQYAWWGSAEPIYIALNRRDQFKTLGRIRDIVIQNVVAHAMGTSRITGLEDQAIDSVTLRDVVFDMSQEQTRDKRATDALQIDRVKECRLQNVRVRWAEAETEPKWASAIRASNIDRLEIEGFAGRQGLRASSSPVVALDNVARGWITRSIAAEGAGTFFEVSGTATRSLRFFDNFVDDAREPFRIGADTRSAVSIR
jgi:polygalacturonase